VSSIADKSLSAEETFDVDLCAVKDMHRELLRLTERTSSRLRGKSLVAGTIQLKIRQADFSTFTRQKALHPPANNTDVIYETGKSLLGTWLGENPGAHIRLLGIGGSELSPDNQQDLFAQDPEDRSSPLDKTVDKIRERFGRSSVSRARTLN
jgi:DNA polymerase-4